MHKREVCAKSSFVLIGIPTETIKDRQWNVPFFSYYILPYVDKICSGKSRQRIILLSLSLPPWLFHWGRLRKWGYCLKFRLRKDFKTLNYYALIVMISIWQTARLVHMLWIISLQFHKGISSLFKIQTLLYDIVYK